MVAIAGIAHVLYRLPAVVAILLYWIMMKVVLSNIGRPNDPAYSTSELLNTPDRPHIRMDHVV